MATTSAYEPPLIWGCDHQFLLVGLPVVTWNSAGTAEEKPPPDAPAMQKRKCMICGGYDLVYVNNEGE